MKRVILVVFLTFSLFSFPSFQFESDELPLDDKEFGLEGAPPRFPGPASIPAATRSPGRGIRGRSLTPRSSSLWSTLLVTPILFPLAPSLPASRLGITVARNGFTDEEKEKFKNLLQGDDFYKIRLPSNVLSPPERDYIILSVKAPFKWAFNSHTVLKNSEQAPRAPIFTKEVLGGENGEGEVVQPPKRCFWAKYWMYLIPLGLIPAAAMQRASNAAVRRR
ncbi:hypothetical protein SLE2022_405410 [Rubroshorea leprosula]